MTNKGKLFWIKKVAMFVIMAGAAIYTRNWYWTGMLIGHVLYVGLVLFATAGNTADDE